jgi:hypothetical protein
MPRLFGLKSLDNCVRQAWYCRFYLDRMPTVETPEDRVTEGVNSCLCISKICQLWSKVRKISGDFLNSVAKDNSARFPTQYRPSFGDFYYHSWHHFGIITIRNAVQEFINNADEMNVENELNLSKSVFRKACS